MGAVLSTSSVLLYVMGEKFLSEKFSNPSTFKCDDIAPCWAEGRTHTLPV